MLGRPRGRGSVLTDEDETELRLPAGTWSAALYVHKTSVGMALGTWDLGTFEVTGEGAVALSADAVTVGGAASWGGEPLRDDVHEVPWLFTLVDVATGAEFEQWVPDGSTWSARVPPGVYDVDLGGGYPSMRTRAHEAVDLTSDATVDVAIEVHTITGTASMNGVDAGSLDYPVVMFIDPRTGGTTAASARGGSWSADVPEGVYEVRIRYEADDQSPYVPVLSAHVVAADGTLAVDGVDYAVSGTLSYPHDVLPDYAGDGDITLYFYDAAERLSFSRRFAYGEAYAVRLPAATYDVYVSSQDPDPRYFSKVKLAGPLVVSGDATADLVLDARWVDVSVSLDGAPVGFTDLLLTWTDPERTLYNEQEEFSEGVTRVLLAAGRYNFWTRLDPLQDAGTADHAAPMEACFVVE
ncbi:MAG: hypothetical protein V4850_14640 [Myxococcota bacterium]